MGITISLILIAAGAILYYAVEAQVQGLNIDAVGIILMAVGAIGLVFSLLFLASFAPFGRHPADHDHVDRRHGRELD